MHKLGQDKKADMEMLESLTDNDFVDFVESLSLKDTMYVLELINTTKAYLEMEAEKMEEDTFAEGNLTAANDVIKQFRL